MALGETLQRARKKRKLTVSQVAGATHMMAQTIESIEREEFDKIAAPIYAKGFIKLYAEHVGLDPKPLIDEYVSGFLGSAGKPVIETADGKTIFDRLAGGNHGTGNEPAKSGDVAPDPAGPVSGELWDHDGIAGGTVAMPEPKPDRDRIGEMLRGIAQWLNLMRRAPAWISAIALKGSGYCVRMTDRIRAGTSLVKVSPGRTISVAAGILVIALFIVSSISRCGGRRRERETVTIPQPPATFHELRPAIEPPEPYID